MKGLATKKLTWFQERLYFYFSDLFDGINERHVLNYYYLLLYLLRRIIFVMTALYLTEFAHEQIILTYFICLANLCLLAGTRPYKAGVQNKLEMINEFVVLYLLLLNWMMHLASTIWPNEEEGQKVYEQLGLVFTISLVGTIVVNFVRIMSTMCV